MKNLIIVLLTALILYSCGEDNITNNGGNPPVSNETLIFSMVEFTLSDSVWFSSRDTLINFVIANTDSLKAKFTLETNCDSLEAPFAEFDIAGNPGFQYNSMHDLNSSHTVYAPTNDTFFIGMYSRMNFPNATRYIKFKNISVYRIY